MTLWNRCAWFFVIFTLAVGIAGLSACDHERGNSPLEPAVTAADLEWRQDMSKDELLAVLNALDVDVSPNADMDEIIAMLEAVTGCGCFGATCGTGYCGHECGNCDGADKECFSGTCQEIWECTAAKIEPTAEAAFSKSADGTLQVRYEANVDSESFDKVRIQSNTSVAGAVQPGTYDLRLFDISACEVCVRAYKDCNEYECLESYVATSGTIELDSGLDGELMLGRTSDLRFEQSYEDPKTGNVYVLPTLTQQPDPRCSSGFEFNTAIDMIALEPGECFPEGDGVTIGSHIGNFEAINCLGETVSLHQYCGARAMWIVAMAGW